MQEPSPSWIAEEDQIQIRNLRPEDLEAVVALDARHVGRRRDEYFRLKLEENLRATGIRISLAAEVEGNFAGFLLARVFYGEFGQMEPAAVLDTLGVHPLYEGQGVGRALLTQLERNLLSLGVNRLETVVDWDNLRFITFFHQAGFRPASRLALELPLQPR